MDFTLRCNSLKCRIQLNNRAVVTTCSHIFCIACTNELGLSKAETAVRVCPACDTPLMNPDDAVETRLDPTEDYKTSVLSGLSPTIIAECAGRALAFYSYQTTQEIMYQEYLAKSLTEKYSMLNSQMDKIVHEANTEISNLRDKLQVAHLEQKRLEDEVHKMADAYREKAKTQAHLHKVYTQLKAQVLSGQVASAASDDAEATLQCATGERLVGGRSSAGGNARLPSDRGGIGLSGRVRSTGSGGSGDGWRGGPSHQPGGRMFGSHNNPVHGTPQHRTRLGEVGGQVYHPAGQGGLYGTPLARQPLSNLNPNAHSAAGTGGVGLSAGMRTGKQTYAGAGPRGPWGGSILSRRS